MNYLAQLHKEDWVGEADKQLGEAKTTEALFFEEKARNMCGDVYLEDIGMYSS